MLNILEESSRPISTSSIAARMRFEGDSSPDYLVIRRLRELLKAGEVERLNGRWRIPGREAESLYGMGTEHFRTHLNLPISRIGAEILGLTGRQPAETSTLVWYDGELDHETPEPGASGWDKFRGICAYYRRCIQNERGSEASAFNNTLGERFIFLRTAGKWYPRPRFPWRISIPIGEHMAPFLKVLPGTGDQSLILGYPVHAVYLEKQEEPDIAFLQPVFVYRLDHRVIAGALKLECQSPRPEINLKWLEHAFPKPETRANFMAACGFLNQRAYWDDTPGPDPEEASPHLANLVKALESFMPECMEDPLSMEAIQDYPIQEPFNTGIYNRAVVMTANKVPYHVNLLKELAAIEHAPDEELDRTALRYLFLDNKDDRDDQGEDEDKRIEVCDYTPINAEQRQAVSALLGDPLTVVTGPPGTGKSQVVTCSVFNARLRNRSVLFSSHNHKAIDAVMERFDTEDSEPLILRANSKENPDLKVTFRDAIKMQLEGNRDPMDCERFSSLWNECERLLNQRGEKARLAEEVGRVSVELGGIEEKKADLYRRLKAETVRYLESNPGVIPQKDMAWLVSRIYALARGGDREIWFRRLVPAIGLLKGLFRYGRVQRSLINIPGMPRLPFWPLRTALEGLLPTLSLLERASEYARLVSASIPLEDKAKALPAYGQLANEIAGLTNRIENLASQLGPVDIERRKGLPPTVSREELHGLGGIIRDAQTGLADGRINRRSVSQIRRYAPVLLERFPCWAVTTLSVGSRLPLVPGIFDIAVIDEASQTDIPSAIPILFRARRAGVVGDPFQLKYTTNLSPAKDVLLRHQSGIGGMRDYRFAYSENSLYDLFSARDDIQPVFLSETFRSTDEIAGYSNEAFYHGRLRVATDANRLITPKGLKPGIHWTEVEGDVVSGGASSCLCQDEAAKVVELVQALLNDKEFKGTVGIVTPFRPQANLIQDSLFSSIIPSARIDETKLHVDTSHGFQGDERDVMFFSVCGGPNMPAGSAGFLRKEAYLFNVAVSRARAVLSVVGNRSWAQRCGIPHIELLARDPGRLRRREPKGPWHPHESPYEKLLFDALVEAGLPPVPQHPVSSRRLDIALVRQDDSSVKIDIEVDGDCHRNPDGTRKEDDIWRDIQLQALGWKVMRFWTYELREDMDRCVRRIKNAWRRS